MAAFTAAQALEMALQVERNGEVYYTAALGRQTNPEIQTLFSELAAQERIHYRIFEKMLGQVGPAPALPAEEYDQYEAYVQAALSNALFAGPDKALRLAEEAADAETAIRGALGFEKDTLLFFYDLREIVADKDREAVSRIIAEEKSHVRRLAARL